MKLLSYFLFILQKGPYGATYLPINTLRNVAVYYSATDYVLLVEADFNLMSDMADRAEETLSKLEEIYQTSNSSCDQVSHVTIIIIATPHAPAPAPYSARPPNLLFWFSHSGSAVHKISVFLKQKKFCHQVTKYRFILYQAFVIPAFGRYRNNSIRPDTREELLQEWNKSAVLPIQ